MEHYTSIIMPAYNESGRIGKTLEGIKDIEEINEIIVVDDGSADSTADEAKAVKSDKVKVFKLDRNRGKGYALNFGIKEALKNADIIGFLDADLGECSYEVIKLIKPVFDGEADVTIAQFPRAKKKGGMGLVKGLAKDSIYEMTGVELNASISGQRIFKREVIERFDEMPYGYGVEVGMSIDILRWGYKIKEVLVQMTHNETGRDLKGFIHRGKQYYHIKKVVRQKKKEWGAK